MLKLLNRLKEKKPNKLVKWKNWEEVKDHNSENKDYRLKKEQNRLQLKNKRKNKLKRLKKKSLDKLDKEQENRPKNLNRF